MKQKIAFVTCKRGEGWYEKGDKKHAGAGTGKMKTGINRYSSERARKLSSNLRSNVPFLLTRKAHLL